MEKASLMVFNVQHYSLHDGEGIRTTIFLKGCPLRCKWCSNPESQNSNPEPMNKSTGVEIVGRLWTVDELIDEAMRDAAFYGDEGGITLSGGEPLLQRNSIDLLRRAKEEYLNTAVETCGDVEQDVLLEAVQYLDQIFYDIKSVNGEKHKAFTGRDGERIRQNLKALYSKFPNKNITVRTPVIPGFNDSDEELGKIEQFLEQFENIKWQKLTYHTYGVGKYEMLGRKYEMP